MGKRFLSVWFSHLHTDWFSRKEPGLREKPFVLSLPSHGKLVISATNKKADLSGIYRGMSVADARAIFPGLQVKDDVEGLSEKLLEKIAIWCIRFSPFVSVDLPDGLIVDATGCAHLWGGELAYVEEIMRRLEDRGYLLHAAMADTAPVAWALSRYGGQKILISEGRLPESFLGLPPEALRLEQSTIEKLHKLGLKSIRQFIGMPANVLRRRYGDHILERINKASGMMEEILIPVRAPEPYEERLPCLEPIISIAGAEIALQKTLEVLTAKLAAEQKGIRSAIFSAHAADGKVHAIDIGTTRPSLNIAHLFSLFSLKMETIRVDAGIELFTLTARWVEEYMVPQEKLWEGSAGLGDTRLAELIDNIENRNGRSVVKRFLPAEHHLPERSVRPAASLTEEAGTIWKSVPMRPLHLLDPPEKIDVTAPIPDYPPMMFRYKGKLHKIARADGPERIEQEWWVATGRHRDYYAVEDEEGQRYWLFRSGHYDAHKTYQWFIHGFFV